MVQFWFPKLWGLELEMGIWRQKYFGAERWKGIDTRESGFATKRPEEAQKEAELRRKDFEQEGPERELGYDNV